MMWKIARRFSVVPVEPSKLDLVLQRGRGLSDFELISVAKDLGNIDPQKLQKNSEMLSDLDTYFKTLSSRIRKMQTSDISLIMKSVVKNTELRSHDLTERF